MMLDRRREPASDDPSVLLPRRLDPGPMFPWAEVVAGSGLRAGSHWTRIDALQHPLAYTGAPSSTAMPIMSASIVNELIDLLQLERLEDNLFRGQSRDIGTRYVFGGQVLGQALSAAQQTVDAGRHAHSLHAYFLRAGDVEAPIIYNVERSRDGGSFSARRIVAIQHGQPIFNMTASFQIAGARRRAPVPDAAGAEARGPAARSTSCRPRNSTRSRPSASAG